MNEGFTKYAGSALAVGLLGFGIGLFPQLLLEAPRLAHAPEEQPVKLLFFGDLMLDRSVRADIDAWGVPWLFEKMAPLMAGQDLIIANAEGPFTGDASVASLHNLVFTFATSTLPQLRALGFTDFSQANNHALNFGWAGLRESQYWIAQSGIRTFGDPDNQAPGPLYEQARGQLIGFVGYDEFSTNHSDASVLNAIAQSKLNGAFTVVFAHWGEEYSTTTTPLQVEEAHRFIDAGADLVVGAHPHVIEPTEVYNGRLICYSLGNFIFDQWWNEAVRSELALAVILSKDEATYTLAPLVRQRTQPAPAGTSTSFVLKRY